MQIGARTDAKKTERCGRRLAQVRAMILELIETCAMPDPTEQFIKSAAKVRRRVFTSKRPKCWINLTERRMREVRFNCVALLESVEMAERQMKVAQFWAITQSLSSERA